MNNPNETGATSQMVAVSEIRTIEALASRTFGERFLRFNSQFTLFRKGYVRTALAACAAGDTLRSQLALLRRLLKREPVDAIALRRKDARAAIEAGRYPI